MNITPLTIPRRNRTAPWWRGLRLVVAATIALGASLRAANAQDNTTAINNQLGLRASTPFTLSFADNAGIAAAGVRFQVPIAGSLQTVELAPHSVRAPNFAVEIQKADGTYEIIGAGPPRTLRGSVVEQPGSIVGGALTADGLQAMILLVDHTKLWIEPIPEGLAAGANDHIVFANNDVLPTGETCMLSHPANNPAITQPAPTSNVPAASDSPPSGAVAGTVTISLAELAADADFDYFSNFGDAGLVANDIENVINLTNIQFERDVQIRHVITRIIVRTAEPNVYSRVCVGGSANGNACFIPADCPGGVCPLEYDPDTLLFTFKNHWDAEQSHIQRDVAQLFTGKDMIGSVIGVAFRGTSSLATICGTQAARNFGYSVVETNCGGCSTLALRLDLSAHELGHNWSADHCDCSMWTMNAGLTSANRFHPSFSIPEISAFRDSLTCLDDANELIRLFLTADRTWIGETGVVQLAAEADFLNGPNQDVTPDTVWTIAPPNTGSIDAAGLFTPANIDGARCVTVTATYTSGGIVRNAQVSFTLYDDQLPLAVASANPPIAAIDARQPTDPDGTNPTGWDAVTITLNGSICTPNVLDFSVTTDGGSLIAPQVVSIGEIDPSTFALQLANAIEPGAWTNVTHVQTGATTRLGYLPADINSDGVTGPSDILDLIDSLNNIGPPRQIWSLDIDRSGVAGAPDILAVIDLLNGAGGFEVWNGTSLP